LEDEDVAAMAVEVDETLVVVDRTTKEEEVEVEAQTSTIHQLSLTVNSRFTASALIMLETGHAALVILAGCPHQSRLSSLRYSSPANYGPAFTPH
jgi:predicted HAD superfamily phosphohydrolase YqeG